MDANQVEAAFSAFLDSETYERMEQTIQETMRAAFRAGWAAASVEQATEG